MKTKIFNVVSFLSILLTITAGVLSIAGIFITGFYPGIIVLTALALIAVGFKLYARKITSKPGSVRKNYYTTFTVFNILIILIVLWMTFVIVHDRVLHN